MFPQVAVQHDGFRDRLYVFGGRRFLDGTDKTDLKNLKANSDGWSFDPSLYQPTKFYAPTGRYSGTDPWKRMADSPVPLMAGTAVPYGPAHVIVPAAATGDQLAHVLNADIEMKTSLILVFQKMA